MIESAKSIIRFYNFSFPWNSSEIEMTLLLLSFSSFRVRTLHFTLFFTCILRAKLIGSFKSNLSFIFIFVFLFISYTFQFSLSLAKLKKKNFQQWSWNVNSIDNRHAQRLFLFIFYIFLQLSALCFVPCWLHTQLQVMRCHFHTIQR